MNKFITWFKKNIFEAHYSEEDCYGIMLFGIFLDFRYWYVWADDPNENKVWYLLSDMESYINEIEKWNKKRKNKIPVPTYSRIPWYVTITNWKSLRYRSRKFGYFLIGAILGFVAKGMI